MREGGGRRDRRVRVVDDGAVRTDLLDMEPAAARGHRGGEEERRSSCAASHPLTAPRTSASSSRRTPRALRACPRSRASCRSSPSRARARARAPRRTRDRSPRAPPPARSARRSRSASIHATASSTTFVPAGVTRFTSPHASASAAVSRRPRRIISFARASPTSRGSRCVPPAPGMMPSVVSGSAERGVRRRHAEIAHERELEPAAERHAVDRRDDRLRRAVERPELRPVEVDLHAHVVLAHPLALLQICPGAERLVSRPRDDDGADRRVRPPPRARACRTRGGSLARARSFDRGDRSSRPRRSPAARREPVSRRSRSCSSLPPLRVRAGGLAPLRLRRRPRPLPSARRSPAPRAARSAP